MHVNFQISLWVGYRVEYVLQVTYLVRIGKGRNKIIYFLVIILVY
jgi:hypothetical protein